MKLNRLTLDMRGATHLIAPLFVVAIVAMVGTYVLVSSHADNLSAYQTGSLNWSLSSATKTTPSFTTSDGSICVTATFAHYNYKLTNAAAYTYKWTIQAYANQKWTTKKTSNNFEYNGTKDHQCYSGFTKGTVYRVAFTPNTATFMKGNYWVWGSKTN